VVGQQTVQLADLGEGVSGVLVDVEPVRAAVVELYRM